jgi:hypothetical protein
MKIMTSNNKAKITVVLAYSSKSSMITTVGETKKQVLPEFPQSTDQIQADHTNEKHQPKQHHSSSTRIYNSTFKPATCNTNPSYQAAANWRAYLDPEANSTQ